MTKVFAFFPKCMLTGFITLNLFWGCATEEKMDDSVQEASSTNTTDLRTEYQESFPKYILSDGKMTGLCIDVLKALEKESGLSIGANDDEFTPFNRLQLNLELGKVDLFAGMKKTEARSKYARFLEPPIYSVNSVIAVRTNDHPPVQTIEDVFGQTVMVPGGSATAKHIRDTYPNITVDEGGDVFTCLKKLTRSRHDYIVYHDIGLIGAIKKMRLENQVTILPIILENYPHYVAVQQTLPPDMVKRLENALTVLKETNQLESFRTRYVN